LAVAIGSGLQAGNELKRYGAVARRLGLVEAGEAAVGLLTATMRIYYGFFGLPLSLWPGFTWSIWHFRTNLKLYIAAIKRYFHASQDIGSAALTDKLTENDRTEASEMSWKSVYWFLIMLGTLVIFAASIDAIISDVK
jgi:hypothetical protein